MTLAQTRAVARLARRSAWRHPWRTALIASLIAMAVLVAVLVAIAMRTIAPSAEEMLASDFGASDLKVELFGYTDEASAWITAELEGTLFVVVDRIHHQDSGIVGTDLESPLIQGIFEVLEGNPPGAGEVAVSWETARRNEVVVGDTYEVPGFDAPFTITAIVLPHLHTSSKLIVLTPLSFAVVAMDGGVTDSLSSRQAEWLIETDEPASMASRIEREWNANAHTLPLPDPIRTFEPERSWIRASNRQEVAQWPMYQDFTQNPSAVASFVAAVLLAEIALLSAAAYASGIRRRLREIGLISTQGATTGQIRAAVVGEAIVTGAIGAVTGAILAIGIALGVQPIAQRLWDPRITHIDITAVDILGPVTLALLAATIAAWLPARTASRVPVLAALQGRMPTSRTPKWIAPLSLTLGAAGLLLMMVAREAHLTASTVRFMMMIGVLLVIGGGVFLSVPLLGAVGRLADRFTVVGRLVARDSARQTIRAASAIAALMVILIGTIAVGVAVRTDEAVAFTTHGEGRGDPRFVFASGSFIDNDAGLSSPVFMPQPDLSAEQEADIAAVIPEAAIFRVTLLDGTAVLAEFADYATVVPIDEMRGGYGDTVIFCLDDVRDSWQTQKCFHADSVDLDPGVAEPSLLDALGVYGARAEFELGNPVLLGNQRASVEISYGEEVFTAEMFPVALSRQQMPRLIVPESWAAERSLLDHSRGAAFFINDLPVTEQQREDIWDISRTEEFSVSVGMDGQLGISNTQSLAILLGVALAAVVVVIGIVTALSTTESDRDIGLMVAVGAAPSLRRRFLGTQTAFHTALAALLAIPIGLLLMSVVSGDEFSWGPLGIWTGGIALPWGMVGIVLFALPLVVGAGTALVVRSLPARPPKRLG